MVDNQLLMLLLHWQEGNGREVKEIAALVSWQVEEQGYLHLKQELVVV